MKSISIKNLAAKCREASFSLLGMSTELKNRVLIQMAANLRANLGRIIKENAKDLKVADQKKLSPAMKDRLILNEKRVEEMARGLEEVAALPDPVGQVVRATDRPNGLHVERVRIPLGVVGVIYESRPNVTVDAAGLCFKSGNAVILRGGSEALHSNKILGTLLQESLKKNGIPPAVITVIPTADRKALNELLTLTQFIDVLIPRGGEGLMKFMEAHSKIPVIKHDKGVCSIFVDETADLAAALWTVENSKVQRPGVCNALENLLVHEKIAAEFLPKLAAHLGACVELRGDPQARKIVPTMRKATEKDWSTEYLELILAVKVVKNIEEAIAFIRKYGSHHTESILTQDQAHALQFIQKLDSSCVMVNASTRFNDGGQLGLGAEIGISTSKLHAYGPMGLEELTTMKFVVHGEGQVRI